MRLRAAVLAVVLITSVLAAIPVAHAATSTTTPAYRSVLTAAISELQRYWACEYPDL